MTNLTIKDVEYNTDVIFVTIPKTKNNISRHFAITNSTWINLIKKYADLRPNNVPHERFFLTYRNGHCISSPIGINTIGKLPKVIAKFLQLPNPELYSGHCFRRSSITHLANAGSDLVTIKRHGGWKSSAVAEGYIDTSLKKKIEVAKMFSEQSSTSSGQSQTQCFSIPNCTSHEFAVEHTTQQNIVSTNNVPGIIINAHDSSQISITVNHNYNNQP